MIKEHLRLTQTRKKEFLYLLSLCDENEIIDQIDLNDTDNTYFSLYDSDLKTIAVISHFQEIKQILFITDPRYRRQGYAQKLFHHIIEILKEKGDTLSCSFSEKYISKNPWMLQKFKLLEVSRDHLMTCSLLQTNEEADLIIKPCEHAFFWSGVHSSCFEQEEDFSFTLYEEGNSYLIQRKEKGIQLNANGEIHSYGLRMHTIGVVILSQRENNLFLSAFGILPQYRKKGYATKALDQIYRQFNAHQIDLHVSSTNKAAFDLYSKYGFQITYTIINYRVL